MKTPFFSKGRKKIEKRRGTIKVSGPQRPTDCLLVAWPGN